MADTKRKAQGTDGGGNDRRKKKYRSADGTPVWGKRSIDGPGVWVSCVKGKERQAVGELCEVFEALALELWPPARSASPSHGESGDENNNNLSIEDQIAKEVSTIRRPATERRIVNCVTNTPCVLFISCRPPVDPVTLVSTHIKNISDTGVTRTRYIHRLVPVSNSCVTNLPEIQALCQSVFGDFFSQYPDEIFRYKVELRVRNHTTLTRQTLIQSVAQCVPHGHIVDLVNPEIFLLIEVFKSVCGVSVVRDYYKYQKFNVMELAHTKNAEDSHESTRMSSLPTTEASLSETTAEVQDTG